MNTDLPGIDAEGLTLDTEVTVYYRDGSITSLLSDTVCQNHEDEHGAHAHDVEEVIDSLAMMVRTGWLSPHPSGDGYYATVPAVGWVSRKVHEAFIIVNATLKGYLQ